MSRNQALRTFLNGPLYQRLRWSALVLVAAGTAVVVYLALTHR